MDTNSGEPWSEMDVWELKHSMEYGRSFAEVAGFLYRDESEVRRMAAALGLKEGGGMGEVLRAASGMGGLEGKKNRLTVYQIGPRVRAITVLRSLVALRLSATT
jgi:hypothetical protein